VGNKKEVNFGKKKKKKAGDWRGLQRYEIAASMYVLLYAFIKCVSEAKRWKEKK